MRKQLIYQLLTLLLSCCCYSDSIVKTKVRSHNTTNNVSNVGNVSSITNKISLNIGNNGLAGINKNKFKRDKTYRWSITYDYCKRLSDYCRLNAIESEIWSTDRDIAICIVKENDKRYCYSCGRLSKEEKYNKLKRYR